MRSTHRGQGEMPLLLALPRRGEGQTKRWPSLGTLHVGPDPLGKVPDSAEVGAWGVTQPSCPAPTQFPAGVFPPFTSGLVLVWRPCAYGGPLTLRRSCHL